MAAAAVGLLNLPPTLGKTNPSKPTRPAPLLLPPPPICLKITLPFFAGHAGIASLPMLLVPPDAMAAAGEFGILEGRTAALVHPLVMASLFFYTLRAGYLGWQWRRVRTIQDEINELKKQVKSPTAVATVAGSQETSPAPPQAPSPVEAKIQQLTEVGMGVTILLHIRCSTKVLSEAAFRAGEEAAGERVV
ncbi:hypothetical protein AXF42_Ash006347 [Apostasia shenzhenica]|uniref:Uncharacterized protein n=1 Tax=Apostasia shenzhenica TaxID=1088818 RepID=A0A2I0AYT3_9ASPA|nr:hypothetical protein AXF42_Ash006347 [Apostasia shenzhenica]